MNNYRDGLKGGPQFLWILDEKVAFSCLQQARERNFPPHIHGTCGPPFRPTLYDGLKIWMDGLADTCTERASEATTTCMRAFGSNSIKSSQREARRWIRNGMGGRCHATSPRNGCKADNSTLPFCLLLWCAASVEYQWIAVALLARWFVWPTFSNGYFKFKQG